MGGCNRHRQLDLTPHGRLPSGPGLSARGSRGAEESGGTVSLAPCALAGLTLGPGCHPLDLVPSEPLRRGSISQPLASEAPSFVCALLYLLWFLQ